MVGDSNSRCFCHRAMITLVTPLHRPSSANVATSVNFYRKHKDHRDVDQSTTTMLCQPFMTTTFAKRAFRCSAPAVWNSLPKTVLSSDSVAVFKFRLKTFLFSQAFSSFSAHWHIAWRQRLWSYDLMALYKSVYCCMLPAWIPVSWTVCCSD